MGVEGVTADAPVGHADEDVASGEDGPDGEIGKLFWGVQGVDDGGGWFDEVEVGEDEPEDEGSEEGAADEAEEGGDGFPHGKVIGEPSEDDVVGGDGEVGERVAVAEGEDGDDDT